MHVSLREQLEDLAGEPVVVLSHARPDADAIGSQIAISLVLKEIGAQVMALNADPVPLALKSLSDLCGIYSLHTDAGQAALKRSHLVLVDCSDPQRVEPDWKVPEQGVWLNVDHHLSNTQFAEHNYVDAQAAATAQVLARELIGSPWMCPEVAQALYTGILADTVGFQSSSTDAHVFEICARLCAAGAQPCAAAHGLFYEERFEKMQLLKGFLGTLQHTETLCLGTLTQDLKARVGALKEDSEGFVQYPLRIQGVRVAALIEETKTGLKGSLRARKERLRVDLLADLFGGGGHACAAGFRIQGISLTDFLPEFKDKALKHIQKGPYHAY